MEASAIGTCTRLMSLKSSSPFCWCAAAHSPAAPLG